MKIVIETGSESHTTSSARVQAKAVGGAIDGKYLYELKDKIVKTQWGTRDKHQSWCVTEYNLPVGFRFVVEGRGRTGAHGRDKNDFKKLYEVGSEETEVASIDINVGLRVCTLKGRLIEAKDLLAKEQEEAKINDEGFLVQVRKV